MSSSSSGFSKSIKLFIYCKGFDDSNFYFKDFNFILDTSLNISTISERIIFDDSFFSGYADVDGSFGFYGNAKIHNLNVIVHSEDTPQSFSFACFDRKNRLGKDFLYRYNIKIINEIISYEKIKDIPMEICSFSMKPLEKRKEDIKIENKITKEQKTFEKYSDAREFLITKEWKIIGSLKEKVFSLYDVRTDLIPLNDDNNDPIFLIINIDNCAAHMKLDTGASISTYDFRLKSKEWKDNAFFGNIEYTLANGFGGNTEGYMCEVQINNQNKMIEFADLRNNLIGANILKLFNFNVNGFLIEKFHILE